MAEWSEMKALLYRLRKSASEIRRIQDTELPELKRQLAEATGIFKGRERKAIRERIAAADRKISGLKEKISRMVQEEGYPDAQTFMAAFRKAEGIVKQYQWELLLWKQETAGKSAEDGEPPERRSVLAELRKVRDEARQPQKHSSRDREER